MAVSGYALAWNNDIRHKPQWFGHHLQQARACMAIIETPPQSRDSSWKLTVSVIQVADAGSITSSLGRAFVYLDKDAPMLYRQGDTLLLPVVWTTVHNSGNPYQFDYARHCRLNNIHYQQYCNGQQVRLYGKAGKNALPLLQRWHNRATAAIAAALPVGQAGGLLQAMLLGDELNLDPELRNAFAGAGIVHVIAISGGNILLLFMFIAWLFKLVRHQKYRWVQYVVALPIIWLYVIMVGASPSAVRAAVMFSILALGFVLNKNSNPPNQLLAAGFVLLCAQPQWLFAIGFQLSFVAVLSLILFYPYVHALYKPGFNNNGALWLQRKLWEILSASLAAEILVAPMVIYYFHNFPLWFLVANVLAFVVIVVAMAGGLSIVALSWMPPVTAAIGCVVDFLVRLFSKVLSFIDAYSPSTLQQLCLSGWQTILVYGIVAGLALLLLLNRSRALFVVLSSAVLLLFSLVWGKWQALQQSRFIVYNVGAYAHIEQTTANRYSVIYSNAPASKVKYAVGEAHINMGATLAKEAPLPHKTYVFNGKRILMADALPLSGRFPVDYIVFTGSPDQDISAIVATYHPKTIIIAGRCSRKQQRKLRQAALAARIQLHITATDGAFVL